MLRSPMKADTKEFFCNRPYCIDNAIGVVAQLGLKEHLRERDQLLVDFSTFFDHPEVGAAWHGYEIDWFSTEERVPSHFPRWHDVNSRLNYVLASEILSDYTEIVVNYYKGYVGWEQIDYVCAFIIRAQVFRMRQERKKNLIRWSMADHWAAAYVLYEFLHWMHVKFQRTMIESTRTVKPDLADMVSAVLASTPCECCAPVIRSQAPCSRNLWARLRFWT